MFKGFTLIVTILFIAGAGCKEIKEKILPSFTVNIPSINLRIPPLPIISEREIPVGALRTKINMDSAIRANTAGTFGSNAVTTVKVKNLVITSANADELNNLSNFESARIRIFNDTSFVDIATIQFPETATDSISIIPHASPDISQYLKGSTLAYNLFWKNRRQTKKHLRLRIDIALDVQ